MSEAAGNYRSPVPRVTPEQAIALLTIGLEPAAGSPVPWTARAGTHSGYWIVQAADGEVVCVLPAGPRAEADARRIAAAGSLDATAPFPGTATSDGR